ERSRASEDRRRLRHGAEALRRLQEADRAWSSRVRGGILDVYLSTRRRLLCAVDRGDGAKQRAVQIRVGLSDAAVVRVIPSAASRPLSACAGGTERSDGGIGAQGPATDGCCHR